MKSHYRLRKEHQQGGGGDTGPYFGSMFLFLFFSVGYPALFPLHMKTLADGSASTCPVLISLNEQKFFDFFNVARRRATRSRQSGFSWGTTV